MMVDFTVGLGAGPAKSAAELGPLNSFGLPVTPKPGEPGSPEAIAAAQAKIVREAEARRAMRAANANNPNSMMILSEADQNGAAKEYARYSLGPNPNLASSTVAPPTAASAQSPGGNSPFVVGPTGSQSNPYDTSNLLSPGVSSFVLGPQFDTGSVSSMTNVTPESSGFMGAGNADYRSELIKSLRQSSVMPFSTNRGVMMAPNRGNANSNVAQPLPLRGGAFNPQVLNQRPASRQEIDDWNAYSTYRTNALNAKTPILSMAEWLAGGKSDGKAPTAPADPVYDGGGG